MADNKAEQISRLKSIIDKNNNQITNLNQTITKMNKAHDSLVQFRKSVASTRDSLQNVTNNQNRYLSPVKEMSNENRSANNYGNGIDKTLSGFGTKVVGLALLGLLAKIDLKLASYKFSIANANSSINQLRSQSENHNSMIRQLEKQIREEEKKQ